MGLNSTAEQKRAWKTQRKARTAEVVTALKDAPCLDCDGRFPPVCMDFDHVRGDKSADISRMIATDYPLSTILAEVELCDLVCANCHRIRSWRRWSVNMKPVVQSEDASVAGRRARSPKTHCIRQHELISPNLRPRLDMPERRECLACKRAHGRVWSAAKRGVHLDLATVADAIYVKLMSAT